MNRNLFAAALCLGFLPQSVLASPIQLISGLPNSYTPGQPVTFDVSLPAISNLGSYNIDLALESTVGTAGVDYYFDEAATLPAATHYVFPSAANFFDASNVDSPTQDRITLTDFDFTGVNLIAGTNDQVAKVVFRTAPNFHGALSVFVDAPLLILDTPDVASTPVAGFDAIQTGISAAGSIEVSAVPEPATFVPCILAILLGYIFAEYRRAA